MPFVWYNVKKGGLDMINYAHRGASEYAPENTLSSFYLGLLQGANGIETDVRKTKDGVLILFHDDTLDRVTDTVGRVEDFTWEELQKVKVYGNCTTGFFDRIVTLREFLEAFSQYDIHFAIELKGAGVEAETLELAKEFGVIEKTTFTSFAFEYIQTIKELEPAARVGWLTSDTSDGAIERLLAIGGEEMAPKASTVTEELMKKWRGAGLGVRAWGVTSIELMKQMCHFGVDGMTVNFPDRLQQYCC
jgi:glycerophosphoryl diester phosphodiesterase